MCSARHMNLGAVPGSLVMEWSKTVPEWTVFNMSRSLDFYTRVLGFRVVYKREGPLFAYLDLDGVQLMLEEFHENGWNTGQLEPPYGRGINIQMEVCDVSSVLSAISDNGIALYRNLTESWYPVEDGQEAGQLEFLVQDPDGYLLRFTQFLATRTQA